MIRKMKRFLVRRLSSELLGGAIAYIFSDKIPHYGCVIDTASPLVRNSVKASIFFRTYEFREVSAIRRYLPSDLDVVELGASIGAVSCQISQRLAPDRKFVAVEAKSSLLEIAERNLKINELANRCTLVCAAIATKDTGEYMQFINGNSNLSGGIGSQHDSFENVPSITLSALLKAHGIGEYALVSDIEGSEAAFILDDVGALKRCRLLIAELHKKSPNWCSANDLKHAIVKQHGFTVVEEHGNADCLVCICVRL